MKKFLNQTLEVKALTISAIATVLGFLGTIFLFWFNRYDIPLGVLYGGGIIALSWLVVLLAKKNGKETAGFDIFIIFARLFLLAAGAVACSLVQRFAKLYTLSPVAIVIAYLAVTLLTLIAFIRKEQNAGD